MTKTAVASIWKLDWLGQNGSGKNVALESRMKEVCRRRPRKQRWRGDEKMKGTFCAAKRLGDASSLGNEGKEGPRYEGLTWCSE